VNRPGQSKARIFGFEQALEVVAPQLAGSGPTVAGFEGELVSFVSFVSFKVWRAPQLGGLRLGTHV
jgi:hypothetical protein